MLRTSTNENTPLGYDEMKTKPKSIFWTASESYLTMNKSDPGPYLISEKSIWKNQVPRTGFLVYFEQNQF